MKKIITISMFLLIAHFANAQGFVASAFVQSSTLGCQKGYSLGYEINQWGLNAVFQSNNHFEFSTENQNHPFYGIEISRTLHQSGNMRLLLTPKVGFVNKNFLIIIPEIQTQIKVIDHLSISIGTGIRAKKISASLTLAYHMNK